MSIAKRLIEEQMDLTCSECGEEFPTILGRQLVAQGMRRAIALTRNNPGNAIEAISARIEELEGPHGMLLTDFEEKTR